MKVHTTLPNGYHPILSIDLQKDKKLALLVNGLGILITLAMILPVHFHHSIFTLFDISYGFGDYWLRVGVLLAGMIVYMILHELMHGVTMKAFGTKRVKYGFTGLYAFAGSEDYYKKIPYLVIALAPVVIWGVVLAVLNVVEPAEWFLVIYLIQVVNCSGAAGDLYVTFRFLRLPKDILVQDQGVGMTVYAPDIKGE